MVDVDNLVDTAEIVKRLGLKRVPIVHNWINRPVGFPEPVKTFQNGAKQFRVWLWTDVEQWYAMWRETHKGDGRL